MARDKAQLVNIDKSDLVRYPNGRIKNNTGGGNGTPVNEEVYGDIHEAKDKIMRMYGISHNGLPDNEINGYQIVEAFIALASKNDFVLPLTSVTGVLNVPLKMGKLQDNESFVLKATVDFSAQTFIKGTIDGTSKAIEVIGDFKIDDYVRMINTSTGVVLVRMVDSFNLETQIQDLEFLKAATGAETILGVLDNKAVTPEAFLEAFAEFVIGAESDNFLVSQTRNGLMRKEDKEKLDNLAGGNDRYGTVLVGDVDTGGVGNSYPVTGDISSAVISGRTKYGNIVTVTLSPAMSSLNYLVRQHLESLGSLEADNDIRALVFKKVSSSQFQFYLEESSGSTQNLKVHLEVIQK